MHSSFGPFSFDESGTRLLRDNAEVAIRPQARRVLQVLLRHRGQPVDYDTMMEEAWEGTFVSKHTVDVTIAAVKKSLAEYARWVTHRPKVGYALEVPASDELVRTGWHFSNRRTREGAERAIHCFAQAAAECPGDFRAYEGLSTCHLMLATFGMRSPRDVYPAFLDGHQRAVDSGGLRPELRCNRAHGLHMFEHRLAEAEAEFLQVLDEKPTFVVAHVRLALLYATLGRLDDALAVLDKGAGMDPLLPTLPATVVNVHVWRREFGEAIAVGQKAVELHPYLQISRANYAQALEFSGRLEDALAQYQLASVLSPDLPWLRALEGVCLAKMRRTREARALLQQLEQVRRFEYVDAYHMAVLLRALGQHDEAFEELERAIAENSASLYAVNVDPKADAFKDDPRFAALVRSRAGAAAVE